MDLRSLRGILKARGWQPRLTVAAMNEVIAESYAGKQRDSKPVQTGGCWLAFARYRTAPGDLADYLIGLIAQDAGCRATVTFDRKLREAPEFRMLS